MNQNVPRTRELLSCSHPPCGAVAIIASAGGISALISLFRSLPETFPLPVFVAQHLPPRYASKLDTILARHSRLNFGWAVEGDQPRNGVYLVPPGMSVVVTAEGFEISPLAPPSSSWLACGDRLIDSLVARYGARTVGIVLSGALPAGVNGLRAIKARGGHTLAQDHLSSQRFEMPAAAIDFAKAEIVMPPERMALALSVIAEGWQVQSAA